MHFECWVIAHCAAKKLANGLGASRPARYALTLNECLETFDVNKTLQICSHLFEITFFVLFSDHKLAKSQVWALRNQFSVFGPRNLGRCRYRLVWYRQTIISDAM